MIHDSAMAMGHDHQPKQMGKEACFFSAPSTGLSAFDPSPSSSVISHRPSTTCPRSSPSLLLSVAPSSASLHQPPLSPHPPRAKAKQKKTKSQREANSQEQKRNISFAQPIDQIADFFFFFFGI